jgi:hypothetical protein
VTLLAITEAAERLGVSTRQVQHLAARGELRLLARGVVDGTSVDRYLTVRGDYHRRAWSEATAWGAVALLSGVSPKWMGESQRSRLKGRLRLLSAAELIAWSRERAEVTRYSGHASTVSRLRAELVDTADAARSLGLADATAVDGYVALDSLTAMVNRHGLGRDDNGRFTLRATTLDLDVVAELAGAGTVLAALDLAESLDARERQVGLDALDDSLGRLRD